FAAGHCRPAEQRGAHDAPGPALERRASGPHPGARGRAGPVMPETIYTDRHGNRYRAVLRCPHSELLHLQRFVVPGELRVRVCCTPAAFNFAYLEAELPGITTELGRHRQVIALERIDGTEDLR